MKNKKVIPIILFETKVGNVEIDKDYLDIFECGNINLNLEYKKSDKGNVLLDLLVEVQNG